MAATSASRRVRMTPARSDVPQVEADFSKGLVRDAPRSSIQPGAVYDAADFLLHMPGIAIKRGGTSYFGPALTGASYAQALGYAEFPAGAQLVAVGSNGHIYNVSAGASPDLGGVTVTTRDTPKLRVGGGKNLVIFTQADGTSVPVKYDGSAAPATLGGSPSPGRYCTVYATRLVVANKVGNENRIGFSPTPDIEAAWDTANAWIDADYAVTGLAALQNALLIFSAGHTERIIGSTPPPGTDMQRATIGAVGCTDARSIVLQEGNCLFANPRGVYLTNGAGFESLTTQGGIEAAWRGLFTGYDMTTWTISAGVYRSFYVVSVLDSTGALVATLMCNIPRKSWWRLTNMPAAMFAPAVGAQEELYYADRSAAQIVALSGIFRPVAANKNDANGLPVQPLLETRMLGRGPGIKVFGYARLSYDMRDAATDNPALAVSVAPGLEATTFAAVPESPLGENSDADRKRFLIAKQAQGVTIRFQQTGPSAKTELYALEYEERPFPLDRGGL